VLADPDLMTSAPPSALVASALNALGHAVEAPLTPLANPVATLACHQAARLLVGGLESADAPERPELALGALLAAYGMDSAGYGLHHVAAQTVVRLGGAPHGAANAALLPHTIVHLERRFPERIGTLARVLGEDPAAAAGRLARLAGAERLRDLGVDVEILPECARAASTRPQLEATPPVAGVEELEAVYRAAW
jgi:alcohol dehydrogenase class IV